VKTFNHTSRRHALTLVEAVVSLAVMAVLAGGMASAVVLATRTIDAEETPAAQASLAADVAGQISEDVQFALNFSERTNHAATFSVPDRDNDGAPEKIRYAWSGTSGDPLTKSYNGSTPVAIAKNVQHFSLNYLLRIMVPEDQACCDETGPCTDQSPDSCLAAGGTPWGRKSTCADVECPGGDTLLFVVANPRSLTSGEQGRQALMTSWGYSVALIGADETQANIDTAANTAVAVYVSGDITAAYLGSKLTSAAIGVVNEEGESAPYLGLGNGYGTNDYTNVSVVNTSHYIMQGFSTGWLSIVQSTQTLQGMNGQAANGLVELAQTWISGANYDPGLFVMEVGAELHGGGTAAGRRVGLPWGGTEFDITALNTNGQTIMQRAIEWAAQDGGGGGAVCGDSNCDAGEDACTCAGDCGPAPGSESNCTDTLDNDCDSLVDCDDSDCSSDIACSCGNGTCDPGEDCNSCGTDCASKTNGPASGRYCCGNGVKESAEGDGTICDGNY
jgi:hypothetical protein